MVAAQYHFTAELHVLFHYGWRYSFQDRVKELWIVLEGTDICGAALSGEKY